MSGSVVCDLSHKWFNAADPLSIKPWQKTLLAYAEALLAAIEVPASLCEPVLPYTLASIPATAELVPRPTRAIEQIAQRDAVDWRVAWRQLDVARKAPVLPGVYRIDTRLCDRIRPGLTWPGAVALEHDLRDVPTLHVWRPPLSASVPESLSIYQPHALLDGWNAPEPLMQRLGMEYFPSPMIADRPRLAIAG